MLRAHEPRNVWWGEMPGTGQEHHPIVCLEIVDLTFLNAVHGTSDDPVVKKIVSSLKNVVVVQPDEVTPASRYNVPLKRKTYFIVRMNIAIPTDNLHSHIGLMSFQRFREIQMKWLRIITDDDATTRGESNGD
jgi:hypothetical protein